jgi:hypothetical protein
MEDVLEFKWLREYRVDQFLKTKQRTILYKGILDYYLGEQISG